MMKPMKTATLVGFLAMGSMVLLPARNAYAQLEIKLASTFDIFSGKNKTGPYTLSWNTIQVSKDQPLDVVIDGQKLGPDGYTVDAAKGTITFTNILSDKSFVRVGYAYDPAVAKRNPNASTSPVTLPVSRLGQNTLSLIAVPNGDPTRSGSVPLVWSLGSTSHLLGGGFTSDVKFAGQEKSGVRLGFSEGNSRNGIDLQFARTEKEFASAVGKAIGMGDAVQRRTLATRLAPSAYFRTSFSQSDTLNLLNNEHKAQDIYGVNLGGVKGVPSLNYTRTSDNTITADRQNTSIDSDKIDVAARLDKITSVSATTSQTVTAMPDPNANSTAKDATLSLTSAANGGQKQATATVNAGVKETKSSLEQKRAVSFRLQPAPIFIVSAGQSEQRLVPVGANRTLGTPTTVLTQTAGAEIVPLPGAKVTSSISETTNDTVKSSVTNFGAQVGAGKAVEISTGVTNRSTEVTGQSVLDTTRAQVALRPMKAVTFTGSYIWNPESNGTVQHALRQEVGMKATLGFIELGSNYVLTTLNGIAVPSEEPQYGTVSLSLGMRFSRYTQLTGSYQDSLRNRSLMEDAPSLAPLYLRTYGLGLTHTLGSSLNFALGTSVTQDRSKGNLPNDVKGEAKLGLRF